MEQLQEGYVLSIAATAGCTVEREDRDNRGFDLLIYRPANDPSLEEVSVFVQLKCTTQIGSVRSRHTFGYQFSDRRHFDVLARRRSAVKAILVVMLADRVQYSWTKGYHSGLVTRRGCYWVNLEGEISAAARPTVQVPVAQRFDARSLTDILDRIDGGTWP